MLPAASGASRLADLITRPDVAALLENSDQRGVLDHELGRIGLRLEELIVPDDSRLAGSAVSEIEIGGNHGFLIVALRNAAGGVTVNPPDETAIREGDTVVVIGHTHDLPQLKARYALRREWTYRGVRYRT